MRRWNLSPLIVLVLLAAGYYAWTAYLRRPSLPVDQIQWLEISLHDQMGKKTEQAASDDRTKIITLLNVLQRGVPTGDHKCGNSGSIMLQLQTGGQLELGLLAGHHEPYYEFRLYTNDWPWKEYEMYRVDRPALLAALADLGITQVDLGGPE